MKRGGMFLLSVIFVFGTVIFTHELLAAPYYEGKVMTIVVGYAPGGGYDRMARILAKHLSKYIPGKPSIIVQNMPGASSMIAANHIYHIIQPDGLTIATVNRGIVFAQIMKLEGVKFDFPKFSWIGSAGVSTNILCVRSDLPIKTFEDIRHLKQALTIGGSGRGDITTHFLLLLKEFNQLNIKPIAYRSTSDIALAIERKEIEGHVSSYDAIRPQIERGLLRPLIRSKIPEPGIENLPVDEEVTADKKGKSFMALLSSIDKLGRPYVAPPGTPSEVMDILRNAFGKVADDPELKGDAERAMMPVRYTSADECQRVSEQLLNQPPELLKEFSKYLSF